MANVDDLFAIAEGFLAASVEALTHTPAGPPARAFISPGEPALDCCDQLSVHNQLLNETDLNLRTTNAALSGMQRINRGGLAQVTVSILITRCIPVPKVTAGEKISLPDPIDMQTAAQTLDEDAWALWLGLSYALKHGTLKDLCTGAERLGGTKLTPQGGCGGWLFQYRYPIEGGVLPGTVPPAPEPGPEPEPEPPTFFDDFDRADGPLGASWITPFVWSTATVIDGGRMTTPAGMGFGGARTAMSFTIDRVVEWTMAVTDQSVDAPNIDVQRGPAFDEPTAIGDVYLLMLVSADAGHYAPVIRKRTDVSLPIILDGPSVPSSFIPNALSGRSRVSFVTIGSDTQITWEYWDGAAWQQSAQILATGADSLTSGGGWVGVELFEGQFIDDFAVTEI